MKKYALNLKIQEAFGNLYRKRHVIVACSDKNNHILVGAKPDFYPKGISRLLGGGVKEGEDKIEAAKREILEELGVNLKNKDFIPLGVIAAKAVTKDGREFKNTTYLFFSKIKTNKYRAGGDIRKIVPLTLSQLRKLADKFDSLKDDFWYEGVEGKHSWGDYGKFYGKIHRIVYDEIVSRKLLQ